MALVDAECLALATWSHGKDNAPENLAVGRHISLDILKSEKSLRRSIARKRLRAGRDEGYLETVLSKAL